MGPGSWLKHLMPKKLRSLAARPLSPQPDSRIDCAIVTEAGTWYRRMLALAGAAAAAMYFALLSEPSGTSVVGGFVAQAASLALVTRYACDTYPPPTSRSHCAVRRTVPETVSP